jgi:mono/diheme cytochrome c family protein
VLLVTLAGFGAAMLARPVFGHAGLQGLGLEQPPRALPGSFYTVRVQPLFDTHCVACHGARRQKGELRLDSFAAAMLGGRSGTTVRLGDAKASELFARITLPASDDRAMPPSGKTPLSPDEITVIRLWIAGGARGDQPAAQVKGAPRLVKPVVIPEIDPAAVARQRAPLAAAVRQLQSRLPGILDYESRDSANLTVAASLMGARFGDSELAQLAPVAARIARADFSGTAITDASAPALAAMTGLENLRLADTQITDTTIAALTPLKKLRALTVTGTKATAASLSSLRQRGVAIYADTDVQ